jgi:hypothetical protein
MRLRNLFVLGAFTAMSFGMISCGKKAEEPKPADSMMTPAPAPTPTPVPVDSVKGEQQKKDADQMKKGADQMKKEGEKKTK